MTPVSFAVARWSLPNFCVTISGVSTDQLTDEDYSRLAKAVLHRRTRELRLSQQEIQDRGGPSTTTQSVIEREEWRLGKSDKTLRNLDRGLGWVEGSAWSVLHDATTPKVDDAERPALGDTSPLRAVMPLPRIEGGPLRRLLEIQKQLDLVIEELRAE